MQGLLLILAIVGTIAIFTTTKTGREIMKSIGFRDRIAGAAPSDDVSYLLSLCRNDEAEVERRLVLEQTQVPHLTEAEHYRRAIRKVRAEREV